VAFLNLTVFPGVPPAPSIAVIPAVAPPLAPAVVPPTALAAVLPPPAAPSVAPPPPAAPTPSHLIRAELLKLDPTKDPKAFLDSL
jgi:hypothetical protein